MKIDTAEIKARNSLRWTMLRDGIKFQEMGGGIIRCLCPFHKEKSPSCTVYPDEHFYCYGCHSSGDVIGWTMKFHNLSFKEALEKLSGNIPINVFHAPVWTPPPAPRETPPLAGADEMMRRWKTETDFDDLDLFAFELGVSTTSMIDMGVAWAAPHNAWAFPMRDAHGNAVGIRLRGKAGNKWAVKGSKEGLFMCRFVKGRTTFLVEGPTDACAGLTLDLNVVGRPSCQGAIKELVALVELQGFKEVVIISDNDAPGLAGSERLEQHLPCPYRELVLPCKDLREFLKLGGTKQLLESMASKQIPRRKPGK